MKKLKKARTTMATEAKVTEARGKIQVVITQTLDLTTTWEIDDPEDEDVLNDIVQNLANYHASEVEDRDTGKPIDIGDKVTALEGFEAELIEHESDSDGFDYETNQDEEDEDYDNPSEPEVFLEYKGVTVYHAYRGKENDRDPQLVEARFTYTTSDRVIDIDLSDSGDAFEVLDLENVPSISYDSPLLDDRLKHAEWIKAAIDSGELTDEGLGTDRDEDEAEESEVEA
jgi:hypothetical protein